MEEQQRGDLLVSGRVDLLGRKLALPSKVIEGSGELPETNESLPS